MIEPVVRIIGSTPSSAGDTRHDFIGRFDRTVRRLDEAGWTSALIYTSNAGLDPWVLAQRLIVASSTLRPLVAVQPIYSHPFTVANKVASLATLYGRGVDLNFVAGDHPRDREGLDDALEHDRRYDRITEYAGIVHALLSSPRPVTRTGVFFTVRNLQIPERPRPEERPAFLISGSSPAAQATAKAISACAIEYPDPPRTAREEPVSLERGLRIGIIAAGTEEKAWDVAKRRFPPSEDGAAMRTFASKASDSHWVKGLLMAPEQAEGDPYWLGPFKNFHRACPYLVGSHVQVEAALKSYIRAGYRTFLIDTVATDEEAHDVTKLFAGLARIAPTLEPKT